VRRACTWHMLAVVGLASLLGSSATAQPTPVEGVVSVVQSGQPVAGAVVYLLDVELRAVRAVLTDSVGAFRLMAPEPGPYGLRIERIGFESARFPTFVLPPGGVRSLRPVVQVRPVELEGLSVTADRFVQGGRLPGRHRGNLLVRARVVAPRTDHVPLHRTLERRRRHGRGGRHRAAHGG